jgi:threonine dehydrogenase-like Zn-dependent dehydrogenase
MKAVGLTKYLPINNPESLFDLQVAMPAPSDRDLLVKVEAVSVNAVDTKIRAPKSDVEKEPRILGWDAAGTVEATSPAAMLFRRATRSTTPANLVISGRAINQRRTGCTMADDTTKQDYRDRSRLAGRVLTASFISSMNESPEGNPRISLLLKRPACP